MRGAALFHHLSDTTYGHCLWEASKRMTGVAA